MNNAILGMVRQMQTEFLNKNYVGTQYDYSAPKFEKVGEAYGIKSHVVSEMSEVEAIIKQSLSNDDCELVNIHLSDNKQLVEPRLAGNKPMEDMAPFLERDELESHMVIKPLND